MNDGGGSYKQVLAARLLQASYVFTQAVLQGCACAQLLHADLVQAPRTVQW